MKLGNWRALQAEPGCGGDLGKATLVSPYPGLWNSLGLAPHFQLNLGTPSHLSESLLPPRLLHQLCCTQMRRLLQPFDRGSRGNHATSGQS